MLALVRLAFPQSHVTLDALSPVKDAGFDVIYSSSPAFSKLKTDKVVLRMLMGDLQDWNCPCPFCVAFQKDYPLDISAARSWWSDVNRRRVTKTDAIEGVRLGDALPLFSDALSKSRKEAVRATRIGHNHWVLQGICRSLSERSGPSLLNYVDENVRTYTASGILPRYGEAIRFAQEFILRGVDTRAW
jgi:hypothetical protein